MSEEVGSVNEGSVFIGDFEIPLDAVVTTKIPEDQDLILLIEKSERKTYNDKETGAEKAYYNLQLRLPDFPGEVVFHPFFLSASNLRNRKPARSWKLFLDTLHLTYTTNPANNGLAQFRFKGRVRLDKKTGDYVLDDVVGPA